MTDQDRLLAELAQVRQWLRQVSTHDDSDVCLVCGAWGEERHTADEDGEPCWIPAVENAVAILDRWPINWCDAILAALTGDDHE